MKQTPSFAFYGTPRFALLTLESLQKNNLVPSLVITQPAKPVGRKQIITPSPTEVWARERNIRVVTPESLKDFSADELTGLDIAIVAAYGKMIPERLLAAPKFGTINLHPSLLPKYRGPTPMQSAILAGDKETGVSIMQLDAEMDHGPIFAQETYAMGEKSPTYTELEYALARIGGALLADTVVQIVSEKITAKQQNHDLATYTKKFTTEDGLLEMNKMPANEINARVHALNPEPGTFAFFENHGKKTRVKILETDLKDGTLVIKTVQPEGKTPVSYERFIKNF